MSAPDTSLAAPSFVVAWFRPERGRALIRVWIIAASLVCLGVVLVAMTRVDTLSHGARVTLGVLGALAVVGGPLGAVLGFQRAIGDETYLMLRSDGVLFCDRGRERFIGWSEIDDVLVDATTGCLSLVSVAYGTLALSERFGGVAPRELRDRILTIRRRALMGLLRPE